MNSIILKLMVLPHSHQRRVHFVTSLASAASIFFSAALSPPKHSLQHAFLGMPARSRLFHSAFHMKCSISYYRKMMDIVAYSDGRNDSDHHQSPTCVLGSLYKGPPIPYPPCMGVCHRRLTYVADATYFIFTDSSSST